MKAGILTFHKADNYGAVLQAYALSKELKKLGVESDFIKISDSVATIPDTIPVLESKNPFIKLIKAEKDKRAARFEDFRKTHMANSVFCGDSDSESLNEKYDFFVAGSDQIWNFAIPDTNLSFFLPFAEPEKRFSYAASFGNEKIPAPYYETCKKLLSEFSMLSVREESGAKELEEMTGRNATISPDPTLLLLKSDWNELTRPIECKKYVLLYLLTYDEKAVQIAKEIAEKKHLEVKAISAGFIPQLGFLAYSSYGVLEWLSMIKYASFVVTNSYHGVAFSLIFEKPFCAMPLTAELSKRNVRTLELLKKVSLTNCYDNISDEIHFDDVSMRIEEFRKNGIEYLMNMVR